MEQKDISQRQFHPHYYYTSFHRYDLDPRRQYVYLQNARWNVGISD